MWLHLEAGLKAGLCQLVSGFGLFPMCDDYPISNPVLVGPVDGLVEVGFALHSSMYIKVEIVTNNPVKSIPKCMLS